MSKLVLGRDQLIPVVLCDDLYIACPEFSRVAELRDEARPAWDAAYVNSCCGGKPSILFPALDEFMSKLRDLLAHNPAAVARLRGFLGAKFGSSATPVVIHYRKGRAGKPDKLQF